MRIGREQIGMIVGLVGAALVALLTTYGPHGASASAVQRKLGMAVEKALTAKNLAFAQVEMDGQRAVLHGAAPTPGIARDAEITALRAVGQGGGWSGGITSVDNQIVSAQAVSPFNWTARGGEGSVRLDGYVPSEDVKASLLERANALFPDRVIDETLVASGAPAGEWEEAARAALEELAVLKRGEARIIDTRLVIMGEGDAKTVERVKARYAEGGPPPFDVVVDVTVNGQGLGIPELQGINLADADAKSCQAAFTKIMARNVINFDTGSAVLAGGSQRLLDNLAVVARRCDRYSIEVAGHTDDVGDRTINMALSQSRAEAVVKYLATRGVADGRLSAKGFGPDQPIASNRLPMGQARNRRIEFAVRS